MIRRLPRSIEYEPVSLVEGQNPPEPGSSVTVQEEGSQSDEIEDQ